MESSNEQITIKKVTNIFLNFMVWMYVTSSFL